MNFPARIQLGHFPTPIEKLERLSRHLGGPEIYVKRDDQTGLATGGNKVRKLEFFLADAMAQGCNHVVTMGAPQSNHVRQTAAAAAHLGLECSVVLRGDSSAPRLGNLLLDELLGARIHWSGTRTPQEVADDLTTHLRESGTNPYLIPLGGSSGLGARGYAAAMGETFDQLAALNLRIDTIVFASSSGGTQAGLVLGAVAHDYMGRILGISIDSSEEKLNAAVTEIALEAAILVSVEVTKEQLRVEANANYLGGGYAVVGESERDAVRTVARTEGLLLDPVYTGRAMGGLLDLIRRGELDRKQNLLFWHTGGTAALSAFADAL